MIWQKPNRVDAFGDNLEIEVYQNPEEFLEADEDAMDQLVDVARSAFSKDGVPTEDDASDHLRVPLLVTARSKSGDYVAFSAVSREGETVYEEGIAVTEDLKGSCVGSTLLSRGVMEAVEGDEIFGYRTQNPNMYSCADNCFELYPHPDRDLSEMIDEIEDLGESINQTKRMDGPVMREAYADIYDGGMYSHVPENKDFKSFMYGEEEMNMNFEDGDALIVAGEVSEQEAAHSLGRAARKSNYTFYEDGDPIA